MTLLRKTSKNIGTKVNQLQLRNSFKKSKSIREENEKDAEVMKIMEKYDKELMELRKTLKDKEKSLLITKMIAKVEEEREKTLAAVSGSPHNN